jgi:hypothetical protein
MLPAIDEDWEEPQGQPSGKPMSETGPRQGAPQEARYLPPIRKAQPASSGQGHTKMRRPKTQTEAAQKPIQHQYLRACHLTYHQGGQPPP